MSKRWKSFLGEVIGMFILMASLTLLSDYWMIGEAAFEELLTPKFYIGKIIFSIFLVVPTHLNIWKRWIWFGKKEIDKQ